jgi:ABC-2 type transport system ATP-binding protein
MPVAFSIEEITTKRDQIGSLVSQNMLEKAGQQLLTYAKDFGPDGGDAERKARVLQSSIVRIRRGHLYADSKDDGAKEARIAHSLLELADEILDYNQTHATEWTRREDSKQQAKHDDAPKAQDPRAHPPLESNSTRHSGHRTPGANRNFDLELAAFRARRRQADAPPSEGVVAYSDNLSHRYSNRRGYSLQKVSLQLRVGEITGVVGVNGSGKTTLLRVLAGELAHHGGVLAYPSIAPPDRAMKLAWEHIRRHIAFVKQRPDAWTGTVQDNLHWQAAIHGAFGDENEDVVEFILLRMGLSSFRTYHWNHLSAGYKTRVELARALVSRPLLLVLDEPLAALDPLSQQEFLDNLVAFSDSPRRPIAVILSSQNLYELESITDQLLVLNNGEPRYCGPRNKLGSDRETNAFEIACNADPERLNSLLEPLEASCKSVSLAGALICSPRHCLAADILRRLLEADVTIHYFRDVTSSTRLLLSTAPA